MKNLIIALALIGFTVSSANAQNTACPAPKGQVCKKSGNGSSCYKTKYAHDFKVCKGDYGYYICCEEPTYSNSTHPRINMAAVSNTRNSDNLDQNIVMTDNGNVMTKDPVQEAPQPMVAPQSQSYPEYAMNSATSYEGYYSKNKGKHYIKVCYGGDNVAELNKAAYHSCPTPAYDGPEANKARNVNANNTIDNIPPLTGQPQ